MRKIITLGLLLAILLLVQAWQNSTLITTPAPIITAQVFNKKPAQTTHKKTASLIYFWANWCKLCKSIQANINSMLQEYSSITVAIQSRNKQQIKQFLQDKSLDWAYVVD